MSTNLPISKRIYASLPEGVKPPFRGARRAVRSWMRGGHPRVFLNSLPKSGTHLLASLLEAAGFFLYENQPFNPDVRLDYDPEEFAPHLARVRRGEYLLEHLAWNARAAEMLESAGFRTVFIFRDPRAAAVSFSRYVAEKHPTHRLHRYYKSLPDLDARVRATLEGVADAESRNGIGRPPLSAMYDAFLGWRSSPSVFSVAFEDLVGERGGGSRERQEQAVRGFFAHLGLPAGDEWVARAADAVFNERSATFRAARIEGWRGEVGAETASLLDRALERQLREWGYA